MSAALSIDRVGASAGAAISAGTHLASRPELLQAALRLSADVATYHQVLPLPVALDLACLVRLEGQGLFERAAVVSAADRAYREWFATLARASLGLLDHHGYRQQASRCGDLASLIPVLLAAWPDAAGDSPAHYHWCRQALAEPAAVQQQWAAASRADGERWSWWQPALAMKRNFRLPVLQSLFLPSTAQLTGKYLHYFDHAAGQFFIESRPARLLEDQAHRILKLQQRRPSPQSWPLTQSYDELDPRYGAPTLSAYTGDSIEQVWYDLVSKPRINSPPPHRPPPTVQIHGGWMIDAQAPIEVLQAKPDWHWFPADAGIDLLERPYAHSSLLHGLVALVVDDWRQFLHPLPVEFFVHREYPRCGHGPGGDDNHAYAGGTGRRWRDMWFGRGEVFPPTPVVRLLFGDVARADTFQEASSGLPASERSHSDAWWCLFASAEDLSAAGFKVVSEKDDVPRWRGRWAPAHWPRQIIPYTHVVVLDPVAPADDPAVPGGRIYRIEEAGQETYLLVPVPRREVKREFPYSTLRIHLVDVLIEHLQKRM